MIYERDFMKHTILEHDAVFKNQVHELHRLYRVQRNLVDQVKEKNSIEDMNLSNHTSDNASKRQLPVYGEGSSSQACNGRFQNGRRMIDLELPADEFLDMDETGDTDEITTCLPYKRPRSGREGGSHQSGNSSGSCLDVKNSNGLADLNEPLNWQDSEPVARDMYSHYGRNNVDVQGQRLEKNRVLGAGHDRRTQRDLHLPSHSVQVGYNSAVQPQSYLTTDHSNVIFSRERANHRELEVRSKNPQASYDSYMASNAARLHNDYRPDFVRPWSHWSSSWENPRSSSHQRSYPVQTNPYMNFVSHARPDSSFEMRNAISNGIYHGFSSGSKEATSNFPSGGFRPNVYSGEVVKHKSSEKLQGPRKQESSGGFPWLKPKPSYKSERSNGFFDLNASTDQFMDGTDTWDSRNGVPPQKGLRSSASCSNNANMGRIEMNNPQSSRKFEKLTVCKEEHTPLVFHSADQHKEVNHLVKRDFDINLPCDASVSVDQRGSKAFEKEDGNKAAHKRHYIDLNSCASENDEDSGMPSRLRVKSKGNFWIDLEAPPALESEEEEREGSQEKPKEETWGFMKDQDDNSLDELIKEAAQAIVAISLSDHQRHPDDAASSSTDAASKSPLSWFADIITSGELEKKVDGSPEATNLESYREEYSSGEIDYFEAMTLNLHPTKEEDYMPEPLVPKNLILEGTGLTKLRRGQARRGRPKRDFQRDTLPGLSSLSRQEVTEDMQLFGGLMKSREQTWSSGVAARRNSKRKRTVTNISQDQVGPQPENVSVVGLEESKLTGWGKATRRPRRQRCPPAGNPSTVVFT